MVQNLKRLRMDAGYSQQRLAELIGVSQQSVNKYENSAVEPDISTLIRLSDLFGVSVDFLIGHTERTDRSAASPEDHRLPSSRHLTNEECKTVENLLKTYLKTKRTAGK